MIPFRSFCAIVGRDLKRMRRQRGRLLSSMIRPLIWLFIIGGGFGALLRQLGHDDYQAYLVSGILCMTLLFSAMLASLSLVYDKESGVMRMLMVAPFPHYWILLARTTGAMLVGLSHTLLLYIILIALGYVTVVPNIPLLLAGMVLIAWVSASFGTLIAVCSRTLENFAVIMNFFIFPVFFLSGALYPIAYLPPALKVFTLINPFSYGVDMLRHASRLTLSDQVFGTDFTLRQDFLVLIGYGVVVLSLACLLFSRQHLFEQFAARLSGEK